MAKKSKVPKRPKPLKVSRTKAIRLLTEVFEAGFTGCYSTGNLSISVFPFEDGYRMQITGKKVGVKFIAELPELWDVMSEYASFTEWKFEKYEVE